MSIERDIIRKHHEAIGREGGKAKWRNIQSQEERSRIMREVRRKGIENSKKNITNGEDKN